MPRHVQEAQDALQPTLRVQNQLLVLDRQADTFAQLDALIVHRFHRFVPLGQAVAWIV